MADVAVAIMKLADLVIALDAAPLNKHKGCWEHDIDQRWSVYWNGHGEPQKSSRGVEVPGFTCAVHYNGWPAGLINPYGGIIAAGEAANENTFIAAIEAALSKLKQGSSAAECEAHNLEVAGSNPAPASSNAVQPGC